MPEKNETPIIYDKIWYWKKRFPGRKGQSCRIVSRSKVSVLVEFEDGFRAVTSWYGVRKNKGVVDHAG
jgi:hypothetical protein